MKKPKPVSKAPIVKAKKASANGTVRKGTLKPPLTGPKPSFRDAGGTVK